MQNTKRIFFIGVIGLLLLNLIQAGITELLDDEAYYWIYSRNLAWGYYDHPPMIALMIRAGYSIFHNELGLRLFSCLAIGFCPFIMYELIRPKDPIPLLVIIYSLGLIHFGGFLAAPDAPLVFFSGIYLLTFRNFLKKRSLLNAIWLGMAMSSLLYSKYQGLLIIFFSLLANAYLIRKKNLWLSFLFTAMLMIPYFIWQFNQGLPTLEFYLKERNASTKYQLHFTTDYILGQLFLFGPLIGWMIFIASILKKTRGDSWIRTLKSIVWGVTGFFLLASFIMPIETNWTAIAIIPGIILLYYYLDQSKTMEKILYRLFPFSLAIILFIRICFVTDILGNHVDLNKELHENKEWTGVIKEKSKGYPVYFINSYQLASKYIFYQQSAATSYNDIYYRNNQFDLWHPESKWLNDSILVVSTNRIYVAKDSVSSLQGRLYCQMFANPNVNADYGFSRQIPRRKTLVRFFEKAGARAQ
jgi:hypothetical protein